MTEPSDDHPIERMLNTGEAAVAMVRRFFAGYFWLIFKNVAGWLLILLSFPIGVALPGPGGLPMFLFGFALVAFPGKRRLTSHFLRGRPLRIEASIFTSLTTIASLIVVGALLWIIGERYQQLIAYFKLDPKESTPGFIAAVAGVCIIAMVVTFGMMRLGLLFVNKLIRLIPRIRRLVRPYLRKWGIVLLPPPKRQMGLIPRREGLEILELSETSRQRFIRFWTFSRPWARRFAGLGATAVLLYFVIEPIVRGWDRTMPYINEIQPLRFLVATAMAAAFLLVFRVGSWWTLLASFGHRLRFAPAMRVWVTSELSRYVPGTNWQVVGRSFLAKPYNVPPAVCATSHVLELVLFVLANATFAILCLMLLGVKHTADESTRWWLVVGVSLMPLLLFLLHPRVFYSIANRVLLAIGRDRLQKSASGGTLAAMLLWKIAGLAFLSWAIWLIAGQPLHLPVSQWWLMGGIYAIAWLAGFAAFWAPSGIGVREAVFMSLLMLALPASSRHDFSPDALAAFCGLLALVLRVWIVVAEMVVALLAYGLDLDGALSILRTDRRGNGR